MTNPADLLLPLIRAKSDFASGGELDLSHTLARELSLRGADEVVVDSASRIDGPPTAWVAARFGTPRLLVNAHIDTVPANTGWSGDPWSPRVSDGRITGLGACDTKGAIAAILAALDEVRPHDTMVLFSGDEEHGNVAMRAIVAKGLLSGLTRAIVCEPTGLRAGVRHRGIFSFEATVTSEGGHSSRADFVRSPLAVLSRLGVALDDWARARRQTGPAGFPGVCLNLAKLDGGVAFNVIPARATLCASVRPPPGADVDAMQAEISAVAAKAAPEASLRFLMANAPFQTRDLAGFAPFLGEAAEHPIDLGFWTEAAMLAQAGVDAVVFGPGHIEAAHSPDEWVSIDELNQARDTFVRAFRATQDGHGTR